MLIILIIKLIQLNSSSGSYTNSEGVETMGVFDHDSITFGPATIEENETDEVIVISDDDSDNEGQRE